MVSQVITNYLFAGAELIHIGGIQKIAAGIGIGIHNIKTGGSIGAPAAFGTKTHCAQAQFRNFKARAAQ